LFLAESRVRELKEEVASHGLTITRGGRFYHLMGADQDKGRAVKETTRLFQAGCDNDLITVGLGDAQNDYPMLRVVDIPVLVPRPDGTYDSMKIPGLRKAPFAGS
ncbi:MAG: HAD-IIB family hydrolase, partial [Desulfobulbales bacterium]